MTTRTPSADVLAAFGCQGPVEPLAGGQDEAVRFRNTMLKPASDVEECAWIAGIYPRIPQVGFRLPQPVASAGGLWVVDGWQAWEMVAGEHRQDRWPDVLETCRSFHRAFVGIERPPFLERRNHPWARADRIAWGEAPLACHPLLMPSLERLASLLQPLDLPVQVIHGDFSENVLFASGLAPAVIDFSPYWRPAAWAEAIVVADALDWGGAEYSLLEHVAGTPEIDQLLVRAEIYRIASYDGQIGEEIAIRRALAGHRSMIGLLQSRVGGGGDM